MCYDNIHPSPISSQIYPSSLPTQCWVLFVLSLCLLSPSCTAQSVGRAALHWSLIALLGATLLKKVDSIYEQLSITSDSLLGWDFVRTFPLHAGIWFGLSLQRSSVGCRINWQLCVSCPTVSEAVIHQLWLLHSLCSLFQSDPWSRGVI